VTSTRRTSTAPPTQSTGVVAATAIQTTTRIGGAYQAGIVDGAALIAGLFAVAPLVL
jgi:hypothetical protein